MPAQTCVCVYVRLRACEVVTRQVWPARCTCGCSSNYWTLFTSSGADDGCSHAGLSARKRNADRHHKTPRGQATQLPPRLKRVAWPPYVRMSYKNKHVRCHTTVTWASFSVSFLFFGLHQSLRERRPELARLKKNSCQLLRPCYSVMLKADQHFLLLSPPQNVSTNGKERLPWPHCLLWIWISVLILSDCGDVYRNNQAISYTYERRVFTTVGLTFHQIVSNKIQQCKHGGGSCTSWEAC